MPRRKATPKQQPPMPNPVLTPLPQRRRIKPIRARISAAINMPPDLYQKALKRAAARHDNNFSAYVRALIDSDLAA